MNAPYVIPDEYFFRLHHIRPRFKNNVEEVLLYVASSIYSLGEMDQSSFNKKLNIILKQFNANASLTEKTIDNWRTEISALFSFIQHTGNNLYPGVMAKRLAENQYLDEFFNYFLYTFQYPGGHSSNYKVIEQINRGVKFKPCQFILSVLKEGCKKAEKNFYLTIEEVTFCIFNDLRVTTGKSNAAEVAELIVQNRENKVDYFYDYDSLQTASGNFPSRGDITRYAGDIMDYMVLANLLVSKTGYYYSLNDENERAIEKHLTSEKWCNIYDEYFNVETISNQDITLLEKDWFDYVNEVSDVEEFAPRLESKSMDDISSWLEEYYSQLKSKNNTPTKVVGDYGETLVLLHEHLRTKNKSKRQHLINKIPTPLGVGYDIQSIEIPDRKRYIEVKTTRSKKAINNNRFRLTPNEWDTAMTLKENYYIYYLVINDYQKRIFIIQNPVVQCESNKISVDKDLNVQFEGDSGYWVDLLEVGNA